MALTPNEASFLGCGLELVVYGMARLLYHAFRSLTVSLHSRSQYHALCCRPRLFDPET